MRKNSKPAPTGTSIHSAPTPDAALQRLNHLGIAPPMEYGRFPDARAQFGLTRSKIYELLAEGKITAARVRKKGASYGVTLLCMQSIRDFLRANTH